MLEKDDCADKLDITARLFSYGILMKNNERKKKRLITSNVDTSCNGRKFNKILHERNIYSLLPVQQITVDLIARGKKKKFVT